MDITMMILILMDESMERKGGNCSLCIIYIELEIYKIKKYLNCFFIIILSQPTVLFNYIFK
jgi:hypothetical protein